MGGKTTSHSERENNNEQTKGQNTNILSGINSQIQIHRLNLLQKWLKNIKIHRPHSNTNRTHKTVQMVTFKMTKYSKTKYKNYQISRNLSECIFRQITPSEYSVIANHSQTNCLMVPIGSIHVVPSIDLIHWLPITFSSHSQSRNLSWSTFIECLFLNITFRPK